MSTIRDKVEDLFIRKPSISAKSKFHYYVFLRLAELGYLRKETKVFVSGSSYNPEVIALEFVNNEYGLELKIFGVDISSTNFDMGKWYLQQLGIDPTKFLLKTMDVRNIENDSEFSKHLPFDIISDLRAGPLCYCNSYESRLQLLHTYSRLLNENGYFFVSFNRASESLRTHMTEPETIKVPIPHSYREPTYIWVFQQPLVRCPKQIT